MAHLKIQIYEGSINPLFWENLPGQFHQFPPFCRELVTAAALRRSSRARKSLGISAGLHLRSFFPHKKWRQNRVRMGLISVATSTWPNFSSETRRWGFTTGNAEPKSNALRASSSSLFGIFCYQDVLRVTWVKHPYMTMGTSKNKWPNYQLIWLIRKLYDRKNTARFCVQIMLTDLGCSILGFCSKLLSQHLSLLGAGQCWSGHDGQILTGVNMCTQSNVKG